MAIDPTQYISTVFSVIEIRLSNAEAGSGTPTPPGVTISGTLPVMIEGQPYDAQMTVTPPGSPVLIEDTAVLAYLAARSATHNGFGRITSASITL